MFLYIVVFTQIINTKNHPYYTHDTSINYSAVFKQIILNTKHSTYLEQYLHKLLKDKPSLVVLCPVGKIFILGMR